MKKIIKLYKKYEEIINYIIAGALTTFVSLFTYYFCVYTFLDPKDPLKLQLANIISWIFSVTFAYFINRIFVFKSKNKNKIKEAVKFYLSRISTLFIDMFTMFLLVTILNISDKISKIFVQFIVLVLNYIFSKFLIFSNKKGEKKKVLFTTYNLEIGGIETCLVNLVNNFDFDKYEVDIILQKKEGELLKQLNNNVYVSDYNLSKIENNFLRKIINLFKIIKIYILNYRKYDFSICYGYGYKPSSILALLASKNNAVWMHTNIVQFIKNANKLTNDSLKTNVDKFLSNISFKKFKKYFFVSKNALDVYVSLYPEEKEKCILCYNFIDYKKIIEKSNLPISDKFDNKNTIFINISRHTEFDKKLSRIINAAEKLKEEYVFKIIMIGDGANHSDYIKLVKEKKLDKYIIFYGMKENPFPYLKACDALVMSSSFEGFPTTFTEAMTLNVPIITTDVSDAIAVIKDKYGIVVENNDYSIYDGMKKFLEEGFVIKKKFNPKKYNEQSLNKIYEVIENKR